VKINDLKYGSEKFEFTDWYWNGRELISYFRRSGRTARNWANWAT